MTKQRAYPLTPAQRRGLQSELLAERARLERSLSAAGDVGVGIGGLALQSRTQGSYERVLDSLRRLEEGTYGTCASCRDPIPYGRLLVMPEATHCLGCGALA